MRGENISTSNLVNPFVPLNGVVDQAELFFNRQQELKRIFELLNSRSRVMGRQEEKPITCYSLLSMPIPNAQCPTNTKD